MKKILILFVLVSFGLTSIAQKENGTVFNEHPAIDKVQDLWSAFESSDKDAYGSFLADTIWVIFNGNSDKRLRDKHVEHLDWWAENFKDIKVFDDKPAYPDAIEYNESGVWVQDWIRIQAIHIASGINLDLKVHNLYSFNEEGQIKSLHHYFNNDKFEQIRKSGIKQQNGKVYINHPYISSVRKLVNTYCSKDVDAMKGFYSPKAMFSNLTMKFGEKNNLETQIELWKERLAGIESVKMKEIGYPDCIYYEESGDYVVFSWWIYKAVTSEEEKIEIPMMLMHTFDKEGLIINSMGYWSSNHYE